MKTKALLLSSLLLLLTGPVHAQDPPMSWGDVPAEDLVMTEWPDDPQADAIILGEYGDVTVDAEGAVSFDYHLRVKVLTASAVDEWASFSVPYRTGKDGQRIRDLQGQTIHLDGTKPRRFKAGRSALNKKSIGPNLDQWTLEFPSVRPGSVIEVRYQMTADSYVFKPNWTFQHREPTRWSEFRSTRSSRLDYVWWDNVEAFDIEETREIKARAPRGNSWIARRVPTVSIEPETVHSEAGDVVRRTGATRRLKFHAPSELLDKWQRVADKLQQFESFREVSEKTSGIREKARRLAREIWNRTDAQLARVFESRADLQGPGTWNRWVMRDVPALRAEPFVTTMEDYQARIEFQLRAISTPEGSFEVIGDWDNFASRLRSIDSFKHVFSTTPAVQKEVAELTATLSNDREKLAAIHEFVRSKISWNGEFGVYDGTHPDHVLRSRTVNSGEQALLFASMLRAAGLEANPVLLATRTSGQVSREYPLARQFDYLLTYVKIGDEELLIDVTDPNAPLSLLPLRALNQTGWMLTATGHTWQPVGARQKDAHDLSFVGSIDDDGQLVGTITSVNHGYRALAIRKALKNMEIPDAVRKFVLDGSAAVDLQSYRFSGIDDVEGPVTIVSSVTVPSVGNAQENVIQIASQPIGQMKHHPFAAAERRYPVDMGYGRDFKYRFELTLPDGYEVLRVPEEVDERLSGDRGRFMSRMSFSESTLVLESRLKVNQPRFAPEEYQALRNLYQRVVETHAGSALLGRIVM